ncbi:hypothetical protein EON65_52905 [archaeon]|nr:MAG: hypothetical protein EON65_52905 [archaeon]
MLSSVVGAVQTQAKGSPTGSAGNNNEPFIVAQENDGSPALQLDLVFPLDTGEKIVLFRNPDMLDIESPPDGSPPKAGMRRSSRLKMRLDSKSSTGPSESKVNNQQSTNICDGNDDCALLSSATGAKPVNEHEVVLYDLENAGHGEHTMVLGGMSETYVLGDPPGDAAEDTFEQATTVALYGSTDGSEVLDSVQKL